MAICTSCKVNEASMFSSLCPTCLNDPETYRRAASLSQPVSNPLSEGAAASIVGKGMMWLCSIAILVGLVVAFSDPWGERIRILVYAVPGLIGLFFGYLLAKVGSVLMHLERKTRSDGGA